MKGIIKTHSTRSLEDHLDEPYNGERRKQASGEHAKAATSKNLLPPYLAYFYGTNERAHSGS